MKKPTFLENMSARTEKRILWIIAALLVMAVIFVFSSQASFASEELSDAFAGLLSMEQQDLATRVSNQSILFGLTLRKLAHIFLFAALGFCVYQALDGVKRRWAIAAGVGYLYGVLDELHQSMSGRHGRWQDTLVDLVGVALGLAAALLLPKLNALCKKWFYENWDDKHPVAKRRLEWCLDALSLAAVMQYVGYRFLQTTMFEFIYSELYKTATFLSLVVLGGVRFIYLFARKLWADSDEKAQITRILKFVGACCLALPFLIVAYLHDYKPLVFIPICWMCLYNMQAEIVFKWYVRVIGIMLGATVLCCLAGVVKNIGRFDIVGFVQSYGIINTTDFAAYFIFLSLFAWCAQSIHKWYISLVTAALMAAAGIYVFRITGSRTAPICCGLAAAACLWEWLDSVLLSKHKWTTWLPKATGVLAVCVFPFMISAMTVLTYLRGQENAWAVHLDTLLSSRLRLAWQVYEKYGIHWLGNNIEMHGIGASLIRDWRFYDFLDCSYEYLVIRDGLIFTAVIMGLWMWLTIRANRSKNAKIVLSMAIIAVYAFSESHFVDIPYNILLAMPFCMFSAPMVMQRNEFVNESTDNMPNGLRWFNYISALCLVFAGYLVLPKVISLLRTLFYLYEWNHGMKTMSAFILSTGIIVLLYIIWILLNQVWYRKSKLAGIIMACMVMLVIALGFFSYNEIKQGMVDQQKTLNAETEAVHMVMNSAEKPVYALEKAELYHRSFRGITESIMTPEDFLHGREGTILTHMSHELPVVINYGARYLQLSETSGVYSFDPAVIDALTAAGYEWKGFYDSERVCDLEDLARLNRLQLDNQGSLVLKGSRHSLAENRYVDQWTGDYEVRYSIHIDPNIDWESSEKPICTLKVMGYKGEEILLEQDVFLSDYDEEGHCVITLPYSISSTPRTDYRVYAADGVTLYVDEIAWRRVA